MKVYEALASAVALEGTEVVFTLMDAFTLDLTVEISERRGIRTITTRHEQGAVLMADGYARATGKPGVCVIGAGPALAQTGTGLTTARRHRSPVIVISAETPVVGDAAKSFDSRLFVEATAQKYVPLRSGATVAEDVERAFRYARGGSGPVVICVPSDILDGDLQQEWRYQPTAPTAASTQRAQPDPMMVKRAAVILNEARRPVLLAGRGAVTSGAREQIETLASRTGALLANTLQANGYFGDHPYALGIAGSFGTETMSSLLAEADCVLAMGASLNVYTTKHGNLFPDARLIQIDTHPEHMGETVRPEIGIHGDAQATVSALNDYFEREGIPPKQGYRSEDVALRVAGSRTGRQQSYVESPGVLDPNLVVAELSRALTDDSIVVTDAGHFLLFVVTQLEVPGPDALIWGADFSAVGVGIPMTIGAAVGRPDRNCVLIVGDGGFMMSLPELDTAVRNTLPLTMVVMNDGAFGAEVHQLKRKGKPVTLARYDNLELADVARALGARGLTVRTQPELQAAIGQIGTGAGPLVVDVKINPDVKHEFMDEGPPPWKAAETGDGDRLSHT